MKFRKRNNEVPGLNTTSTADISFMLLVFFLVTTSMYVDKGLQRQLPPKDKKDKKEITVERENILSLRLSAEGELSVNDSVVDVKDLKQHLEDFMLARGKDHVVMIDADKDCAYEAYFKVQNALGDAYREVRDKIAVTKFGHHLSELTSVDREKVMTECPQRVAENMNENEDENGNENMGGRSI